MRSIAAICAHPFRLNPGMLSADLGLVSLFLGAQGTTQLTLFDPRQPLRIEGNPASLIYQPLASTEALESFDAILYWGDFTHWLQYGQDDWIWGCAHLGLTPAELLDRWYDLFLLENAVERLADKVIVFGNSFYGLTAGQMADARYAAALSRLYGRAKLVMPRDVISAGLAAQIAPQHEPALGCDCAFLLNADAVLPMADALPRNLPDRYLACAFGRSGANELLLQFAQALGDKLGLPVVGLSWFGSPAGLPGLAAKLATLRQASALVTDIYHLAVSGWRERVPVIGIGRARSRAAGTVDDKKKEVLFRQLLAGDYYFYLEDIAQAVTDAERRNGLLAKVAGLINDQAALDCIHAFRLGQEARARKRLLAAIAYTPGAPAASSLG